MRYLIIVYVSAGLISCSGPQDPQGGPDDLPPDDAGQATDPEPIVQADISSSVDRERLGQILGRGPADFLNLVEVERYPLAQAEPFVGWEILRMPQVPDWLDVQVGDIVTAINGFSMPRPEDLWHVYQMLQVASEIRIDVTRNGERRAVRIEITDGPPQHGASGQSQPEPTPDSAAQ